MPFHPMLAPLLPLVAAIPVLTGQEGSQHATSADIVTLSADRYDRMTVPVHFEGKGPYRFLIDTGSQNTVLSKTLASRLSLVPNAKARLIGVAGSQIVDTVEVDQLDLGRRSYYGLLSPLLDANDIGADGILGLDSLQGQRVLMDFRKGLMAIDDASALGGNRGFEIVVTARRRSGQLIMANAMIDGVRTEVVIDTGSDTSIGNPALAKALSRRMKESTILKSVTGQEIEAGIAYGRRLDLEGIHIQNVQIAYANTPAFAALGLDRRPALLLGMRELRIFDRVAIDFQTRKVLFDLPASAF